MFLRSDMSKEKIERILAEKKYNVETQRSSKALFQPKQTKLSQI